MLKLRPHGLAHCGPPCSSFVYINSHTHGRSSSRPFGNWSLRAYVKQANTLLARTKCSRELLQSSLAVLTIVCCFTPMAHDPRITARLAILLLVGLIRGAYFCIEQPCSSVMDKTFPYILHLQKVAQKLFAWRSVSLPLGLTSAKDSLNCECICGVNLSIYDRCQLSAMGCYGHDFLKPTRVFGVAWGTWSCGIFKSTQMDMNRVMFLVWKLSPWIGKLKKKYHQLFVGDRS